jgi:hypothetical protein
MKQDPPRAPRSSKVRTYEGRRLANPDEDMFDQGLAFDLQTLLRSRFHGTCATWSTPRRATSRASRTWAR